MKWYLLLVLISCLFLLSCKNDTKTIKTSISIEENNIAENLMENGQDKETSNCSIDDFLLLRKKSIQQDFFKKIDSVFAIQFPTNEDKKRSLNITPKMLNTYLNDINEQSLRDSLVVFQDVTLANKEYDFKFIPQSFKQWKTSNYKNNIYIRYSAKNCSFGLYINYSCLIDFEEKDEENVVEEHLIFYHFRIINGKIVDFGRNEAG